MLCSSIDGGFKHLDSWVRKIHWGRDRLPTPGFLGFPGGSAGKGFTCIAGDLGSEDPLGRERRPSPVFWPGEFHELYSPWSYKQRVGHNFQVSDFHFHFRRMSPSSPAMVLGGEGQGGGTKRPASGSHGLSVHFTYAHSVPTEDTRLGPHAAPPTRHLGHSCISSQMGPVLLQQLLGDNGGDLPPPFKVLMHTPPRPAEPWGSPLGQGSTPKGLQLAWRRVKSTSLPQSLLAGL